MTTWSRRAALAGLGALPVAACITFEGNAHTPPDTPDSIPVRLPPIIRHEFGGDAQLYMVEDHGVPLVSLAVAIQAGFHDDPPGQAGLASLVVALLNQTVEARADDYADLGATPATRFSANSFGLRCTVHRDDAAAALRLMIASLEAIERSRESFERARRDANELLAARRGSLQLVGGYALILAGLELDPPVVALASGSVQTLSDLTPEQLWSWFEHHVRPSRSSFAVAGDATLDEAVDWISEAAATWTVPARRDAGPRPGELLARDPERHGVALVPWPGSDEAILSYATPIAAYAAPDELVLDYAAGFVTNTIYDELRAKQRTTYAVSSTHWPSRAGVIRQNWISLAPDDVGRAISVVRERIAAWHENPTGLRVAAQRGVYHSRLGSTVRMMRRYEDNESTLTQLLAMADVRLPVEVAHRRFMQLYELDGDSVARAIIENYHPDRMCWSVVAAPRICDGLSETLAQLNRVTRTADQLIGEG